MDNYNLDSVASVLSECMQYSDNEDLSDLDSILLSLRSSSSHVGDLLDEITNQTAVEGYISLCGTFVLCTFMGWRIVGYLMSTAKKICLLFSLSSFLGLTANSLSLSMLGTDIHYALKMG